METSGKTKLDYHFRSIEEHDVRINEYKEELLNVGSFSIKGVFLTFFIFIVDCDKSLLKYKLG